MGTVCTAGYVRHAKAKLKPKMLTHVAFAGDGLVTVHQKHVKY